MLFLLKVMSSQKREHSRKPDEQYDIIKSCSPGPMIELFARQKKKRLVFLGKPN